jgi:hypothetical protein
MFHLFQHKTGKLKGKYDFAFVSKGRFICGSSPQGYNNKSDVYKSVMTLVNYSGCNCFNIQDDTEQRSVVYKAYKNLPKRNIIISIIGSKPKKPYIPNSK